MNLQHQQQDFWSAGLNGSITFGYYYYYITQWLLIRMHTDEGNLIISVTSIKEKKSDMQLSCELHIVL